MNKIKNQSFMFNLDDFSQELPSMKDLNEQINLLKKEIEDMRKDLNNQKSKKGKTD